MWKEIFPVFLSECDPTTTTSDERPTFCLKVKLSEFFVSGLCYLDSRPFACKMQTVDTSI